MSQFLFYLGALLLIISIAYYAFICVQASSREQKILQLLATCIVLLNSMDAFAAASQDAGASEVCLYISSLGYFVGFSFVLFLSVLAHIELNPVIKWVIIGTNLVFAAFTLSNPLHYLMYSRVNFIPHGLGYITERDIEYGPLFHCYVVWYFLTLVVPIVFILIKAAQKPLIFNKQKKIISYFILAGIFAYIPFLLTFLFNTKFDYTPLGVTIASLILLVIIYKFRAFPMKENSEERILNEIDDIMIATDNHNQLVFANSMARRLFDSDNNFIYGLPLNGFSPEIDEILGISDNENYVLNNKTYVCRILDIPSKSEKSIIGSMRWFKDITKESELIDEAVKLKESAESANEAKSRFLANMSHEIRTPINAILGMNELIRRESEDEAISEYAETVNRNGNTLLTIVNDILDFSKIQEGKMEIHPYEYDFSVMMKDLVNMTRTRAAGKSLKVGVSVNPNIPRMLFGDEVRVKQIITNLLTNAVKYTEQGSVAIDADFEQADADTINLIVSVKDTGVGIKTEALGKLFERFERLDNQFNTIVEGTGLGMPITKLLIDEMEGKINVESEYGKGSTFTIVIPQGIRGSQIVGEFSTEEVSEVNSKVKRHQFKAPSARILIVDDNKVNLKVATSLLKFTQMTVETALGGRECLEKVRDNHYDLILLDHRMPEMSGIETMEHLKEDNTHKCVGVPVIAMTADAGPTANEFFIQKGFNDYISKPLIPDDYENIVRIHLPADKVERILDT